MIYLGWNICRFLEYKKVEVDVNDAETQHLSNAVLVMLFFASSEQAIVTNYITKRSSHKDSYFDLDSLTCKSFVPIMSFFLCDLSFDFLCDLSFNHPWGKFTILMILDKINNIKNIQTKFPYKAHFWVYFS